MQEVNRRPSRERRAGFAHPAAVDGACIGACVGVSYTDEGLAVALCTHDLRDILVCQRCVGAP